MAAGDEQVDLCLSHVEGQCSELLDRVDDEQGAAVAAESAERPEIDPIAVAPLDRADDDRLRAGVDDLGERLGR